MSGQCGIFELGEKIVKQVKKNDPINEKFIEDVVAFSNTAFDPVINDPLHLDSFEIFDF